MNSKLALGQKRHLQFDNNDQSNQTKRHILLKNTKITDIDFVCLEFVLENLNIGNLLHVADSNKQLQLAAASVFSRKFGQRKVLLTDIYPKYRTLFERDGTIVVGGLKTCLQFLRCFGKLVKMLDISFVDSSKKHHFLMDEYINQFCADSLIKLSVYGRLTSLMDDIKKPFSTIESLCFEECNLKSNLTRFNTWFPRLRHLMLFSNFLDPICIEVPFPYLDYLATEINHGRSTDIGKDNIEMTLCLNPQLRSLYIRVDTAQKLLFDDFIDVISKNPAIEKLQTHWYYTHSFQNTNVLSQIAKALPGLVELHFTGLVFKNDEIVQFLHEHEHKSLKKFSFALFMRSAYRYLHGIGNWKASRNRNQLITMER